MDGIKRGLKEYLRTKDTWVRETFLKSFRRIFFRLATELNKLKVGQVFTRKERIAIEGKDGYATGEHFHIVVGRGKFRGSGWVKNTNGIWVINTTGGAVKPEDAFFIDNTFTTIKNSAGLNFLDLYIPDIEEDDYWKIIRDSRFNILDITNMSNSISNTNNKK